MRLESAGGSEEAKVDERAPRMAERRSAPGGPCLLRFWWSRWNEFYGDAREASSVDGDAAVADEAVGDQQGHAGRESASHWPAKNRRKFARVSPKSAETSSAGARQRSVFSRLPVQQRGPAARHQLQALGLCVLIERAGLSATTQRVLRR